MKQCSECGCEHTGNDDLCFVCAEKERQDCEADYEHEQAAHEKHEVHHTGCIFCHELEQILARSISPTNT